MPRDPEPNQTITDVEGLLAQARASLERNQALVREQPEAVRRALEAIRARSEREIADQVDDGLRLARSGAAFDAVGLQPDPAVTFARRVHRRHTVV